jgi:8-oxo-dGTP pyrophosphatase MutT (NUDIX family)
MNKFSGFVRPRICGICIEDNRLLMIKHLNVGRLPYLWMPPGGGIEFGEAMPEALKREFQEETGLEIKVGKLLFINEFIHLPIHAVELFFEVYQIGGRLQKGFDPELLQEKQMIDEVCFLSFDEIKNINPMYVHNIFQHCHSIDDLRTMNTYFQLIRKS